VPKADVNIFGLDDKLNEQLCDLKSTNVF